MNPTSVSRREWLITAVLAIVTVLVLSIPFRFNFVGQGMAMDEGMTLLYPELVMHGKVPYRDFETFYGPLNLWTLAGAYSVFGVNIFVERWVGMAYRMALLLGVFMITRRAGRPMAVAGTVCAAIVLVQTEALAVSWLAGVACMIFSVVLLEKGGRNRVVLAGLLGAAALLYRPDLGPGVICSALPLWWRLARPLRWGYVAGFAAGLVPLAILTAIAGPANVFSNLFLYPVVLASAGRRLPLDPLDPKFSMVCLHLAIAFCAIVLGAGVWKRQPRSSYGPLLVSAGFLALGVSHQILQRADPPHVSGGAFLSVSLLPWLLHVLLKHGETASIGSWRGLAYGVASVGFLFVATTDYVENYGICGYLAMTEPAGLRSVFVQQDGRFFPIGSRRKASAVSQLLAVLKFKSQPGQRIFVGGTDLRRAYANDTFIYHMTPWLVPATYFLEVNPLSANRPNSRLASDVASADWLVLSDEWNKILEPNASMFRGSDVPNQVVQQQFDRVMRVGDLTLHRRKPALAAMGPN